MSDLQFGGLVVALNITFWLIMFFVQQWEFYKGRIPPRRHYNRTDPADSFLYIQDFLTNGFGDLVALSVVDAAVVVTMFQQTLSLWMIGPLPFVGVLIYLFHKSCTKPTHRPDWGYPAPGRISWGGRVHLLYAFCQTCLVVIGLGFLFMGQMMVVPMILYFVGGTIWIFAFAIDWKSGRWTAK